MRMTTNKSVGERIKRLRETMYPKVTQDEMAERLGIGSFRYKTWERGGVKTIPMAQLEKIADLHKASLSWLLTGEGPRYKNDKPHLEVVKNGFPPHVKELASKLADLSPELFMVCQMIINSLWEVHKKIIERE